MPSFMVTYEATTIVEADDEDQAESLVYDTAEAGNIFDLLVKNVKECEEEEEGE